MLTLHIYLLCEVHNQPQCLSPNSYIIDAIHQTQDATKSALIMSTLQSACGLTNGDVEIHEN